MVENHNRIPPLPVYELPPAYSRSPPLLPQSLATSRRLLPGSSGGHPPAFSGLENGAPKYTAFDETIGAFELDVPLILARNSDGATRPRYHLSQEFTKSSKPWRLKIRRLLPTESRHLSIPNTSSSRTRVIDYDDDTTLYIIEDQGALNPFKRRSVEIRGRRAKTISGIIKLQSGGRSAGSCDFWHMTRNAAKNSSRVEKMQKYGYHADDEWEKKKLYSSNSRLGTAKEIVWKNEHGKIVANEDGDAFEVMRDVDQKTKDALVTCFVARRWASGKLS